MSLLICRRCVYRIGTVAAGWHRINGAPSFQELPHLPARGGAIGGEAIGLHQTGSRGEVLGCDGRRRRDGSTNRFRAGSRPGFQNGDECEAVRESVVFCVVFLPGARPLEFFFSAYLPYLARDALHDSDVGGYRGTCEI